MNTNTQSKAKRILISGGLGFVGSRLANRILSTRHNVDVAIVDNKSSYYSVDTERLHSQIIQEDRCMAAGNRCCVFHYDIADERRMRDIFARYNFEYIFHLAHEHQGHDNANDVFSTNVDGTWNLINLAKKLSPNALFVYPSSRHIYGDVTPCNEGVSQSRNCMKPTSFAGIARACSEMLVQSSTKDSNMKSVVLRQSTVYGHGQSYRFDDNGWVADLVNGALRGGNIKIGHEGTAECDILYIDDLLDLYDSLLNEGVEDIVNGRIFDVGGGPSNVTTALQVVDCLRYICNHPLPIYSAIGRDRPRGGQRWFVADNEEIRKALEWTPKIAWKEGVYRMVKDAIEQRGELAPTSLRLP